MLQLYIVHIRNSPKVYIRTFELLDCIVIDYKLEGNNYIAEIKIDPNLMQSPSNSYNQNPVPINEIVQEFANGNGYKRNGVKMDMIEDVNTNYIEVGNALKEIINMLKSKGYDVG